MQNVCPKCKTVFDIYDTDRELAQYECPNCDYQKNEKNTKQIKCKKCGYIRKDNDFAPEYECPKCGIIYAKIKVKPEEIIAKTNNSRSDKHYLSIKGIIVLLVPCLLFLIFAIPLRIQYNQKQKILQKLDSFHKVYMENIDWINEEIHEFLDSFPPDYEKTPYLLYCSFRFISINGYYYNSKSDSVIVPYSLECFLTNEYKARETGKVWGNLKEKFRAWDLKEGINMNFQKGFMSSIFFSNWANTIKSYTGMNVKFYDIDISYDRLIEEGWEFFALQPPI